MYHYPPVSLAKDPAIQAMGAMTLFLAPLKYAPLSALLQDLPRR